MVNLPSIPRFTPTPTARTDSSIANQGLLDAARAPGVDPTAATLNGILDGVDRGLGFIQKQDNIDQGRDQNRRAEDQNRRAEEQNRRQELEAKRKEIIFQEQQMKDRETESFLNSIGSDDPAAAQAALETAPLELLVQEEKAVAAALGRNKNKFPPAVAQDIARTIQGVRGNVNDILRPSQTLNRESKLFESLSNQFALRANGLDGEDARFRLVPSAQDGDDNGKPLTSLGSRDAQQGTSQVAYDFIGIRPDNTETVLARGVQSGSKDLGLINQVFGSRIDSVDRGRETTERIKIEEKGAGGGALVGLSSNNNREAIASIARDRVQEQEQQANSTTPNTQNNLEQVIQTRVDETVAAFEERHGRSPSVQELRDIRLKVRRQARG